MSYTQYQSDNANAYLATPQRSHDPSLNHELSNYSQPESNQALSVQEFLSSVELARHDIQVLTQHIAHIGRFHQAALSSTSSAGSAKLEDHVSKTYHLNAQIRDRIKQLERDAVRAPVGSGRTTKTNQVNHLKRSFQDQLRAYQQEESSYRGRYRAQIARQYRIAKTDATEEEVQQAMDMDWGDEGVFQAALKGNRSRDASSALAAVRSRHHDVQRIEMTLAELANLFKDMEELITADEEPLKQAEQDTQDAVGYIEQGDNELEKARRSAIRTRRLKWWTLIVVILIVLVIALALGLYFRFR